jgi:serine/threonine protein kinase
MGAVYLLRDRATGREYAVKRVLDALTRDLRSKYAFLRELLHWSALPPHPHLTRFGFFRFWKGQTLIFAEYVPGGSLEQWIRAGRIQGLASILDIGIQMALGLEAAHRADLVHHDMKPSNVLMTEEGWAKITDFGLARLRGKLGLEPAGAPPPAVPQEAQGGASTPWSGTPLAGLTLAYRAPEQAAGRPRGIRTDVWSWGLCLLRMFMPERTWQYGPAAPHVLEELVRRSEPGAGFPLLPPALAALLERCFRERPGERWESLGAAAGELVRIYEQETGRPYTGWAWRRRLGRTGPAGAPKLVLRFEREYDDPWPWTCKGLEARGLPVEGNEPFLPPRASDKVRQPRTRGSVCPRG